MIVIGKDRDANLWLRVPEPYYLIITCTNNPRILTVKMNCSDVVKVPTKCKEALMHLVVSNLNLVIITCMTSMQLWFQLHLQSNVNSKSIARTSCTNIHCLYSNSTHINSNSKIIWCSFLRSLIVFMVLQLETLNPTRWLVLWLENQT